MEKINCCRCGVTLRNEKPYDSEWIRTNIPLCDLCVEKQKPYMTETRINELLAEQFESNSSPLKRMLEWYKLFNFLAGQTRISLLHMLLGEDHHNLLELVSLNEIEERLESYE